jgi:hypothetical protein
MKIQNREGYDERILKIMMSKPVTPLSRLIGQKWYLPLDKLAEQTGVKITTIQHAVNGKPIQPWNERKIREFLEKL